MLDVLHHQHMEREGLGTLGATPCRLRECRQSQWDCSRHMISRSTPTKMLNTSCRYSLTCHECANMLDRVGTASYRKCTVKTWFLRAETQATASCEKLCRRPWCVCLPPHQKFVLLGSSLDIQCPKKRDRFTVLVNYDTTCMMANDAALR